MAMQDDNSSAYHDEGDAVKPTPALDDDGQVLDSLVTSEAEPPRRGDLPRDTRARVRGEVLPERVEMRTRSLSLPAGTPYLIAPDSRFRKEISIAALCTGTVRIGNSPSVTMGLSDSFILPGAGAPFKTETTDAIYVQSDVVAVVSILEEIYTERGADRV